MYFVESEKRLMVDGFYPIQHLVYDRIRVSLLKLHRALVANGLDVLAVHTDCFVVASTPEFEQFVESEWLLLHKAFRTADKFGGDTTLLKAEQDRLLSRPEVMSAMELPLGLDLSTGRRVEDMGRWHKEPKPKTAKFELWSVRKTPCPEVLSFPRTGSLSDITRAVQSALRSVDDFPVSITPEFPWTVLSDTFKFRGLDVVKLVVTGVLVLGAVAGAGKTTCCQANPRGRVLAIVPTHKRIHEMERDFEDDKFAESVTEVVGMTMAKFVGRSCFEDANKAQFKSEMLAEFDTILLDEIFQADMRDLIDAVALLEKVRDEDVHKTVPRLIMANGDTFQLTNHETWNNIPDRQAYADQFLWRVFPNRVFLEQNWRLKLPAERVLLMSMLAELKKGAKPVDLLNKYGLGGQCFTDISKVVAGRSEPMQCLTLSNQLGNELNGRFAGEEVVGMRVVCKSDKADVKGEGFFTNKTYASRGAAGSARAGNPRDK